MTTPQFSIGWRCEKSEIEMDIPGFGNLHIGTTASMSSTRAAKQTQLRLGPGSAEADGLSDPIPEPSEELTAEGDS